jgi:molybdopterin synthase catalytic subunit
MRNILITEAPFDVAREYQQLQSAALNVGAVTIFVGTVRDINDAADVSGLYLEHYPGMTEKEIEKIMLEAESRWSVIEATVIHRIGSLVPGDEIVFVGVASEHRGDAFNACEFLIDFLKTRATFWKKEQTQEGARWLTTRQSDIDAAENWDQGSGT